MPTMKMKTPPLPLIWTWRNKKVSKLKTISVKNTTNKTIIRGGLKFTPGENNNVTVSQGRFMEIKACRYLRVIDDDTKGKSETVVVRSVIDKERITGGEEPPKEGHSCPYCAKVCKTGGGLKTHVRKSHADQYESFTTGGE